MDSVEKLSQELWDDAFDGLVKDADCLKLVRAYLKTLEKALKYGNAEGTSDGDANDVISAALVDRSKRQRYMEELLIKGRAKVAKASKISKVVGAIANSILLTKPIIDTAIKTIPHAAPAALPWAGVCVGLQILSNPAKATKSNLAGIANVSQKMKWYCALAGHLLDGTYADISLNSALQELRQMVVALYRAILLYQIKSVCSYYRNQGLVFLRALVSLDDWDGDLQQVVSAEKDLQEKWDMYNKVNSRGLFRQLVELSAKIEDLLRQTLWAFTNQQSTTQRDEESNKCLRDLRVVNPQDDMIRIENEKEKLFDDVCKWILENNNYAGFTNWEESNFQQRLLWVKGPAGTGKTMLLISIIRELSSQPANATAIMRSLIWMLLIQQPDLMSHLQQDYSASGGTLFTDINASIAVSRVFEKLLAHADPVYLVVDALDECDQGLEELIKIISRSLSSSNRVRWLVSSTPEIDVIRQVNIRIPGTEHSLGEVDIQSQEDRVGVYIEHKLFELRSSEVGKTYTDDIIDAVRKVVCQRGEGNLYWMSLVFKELKNKRGPYALKHVENFPSEVGKWYDHKLSQLREMERGYWERCCDVLTTVSLVYRLPLSFPELDVLIPWSAETDPYAIAKECDSFLSVDGENINVNQGAAKEHLQKRQDTIGEGVIQGHEDLVRSSISAMQSVLKNNIYDLRDWSVEWEDIQPLVQNKLASIRYSCVFWLDHLRDVIVEHEGTSATLCQDGLKFLKCHFLHWIEALSLLHELSGAIVSIRELLDVVKERFPLQVYGSALAFCPTKSKIRELFWEEKLPSVKNVLGIKEIWNPCRQVLSSYSTTDSAIAFSPNDRMLAIASGDLRIRLWDIYRGTATGQPKQICEGHEGWVNALEFSPNGDILASASSDNTVRLWNSHTGKAKQTLRGHENEVNAVAFSPNGDILASASSDGSILLWAMDSASETKSPKGTIKAPEYGGVNALAFSVTGDQFASASSDKTVRVWKNDAEKATSTPSMVLEGHEDFVIAVAFSRDDESIISASVDEEVRIWQIGSDENTRISISTKRWALVREAVFSSNGKILATAPSDKTVRLWDIDLLKSNNGPRNTIMAHPSMVRALAISHDSKILASASDDQTVRLWDIDSATRMADTSYTGLESSVLAVALSSNGEKFASASEDGTVWLWHINSEVTTGWSKRLLGRHQSLVVTLTFSPDSEILASASFNGTVQLWSVSSRSDTALLREPLTGHKRLVKVIAFSSDGKKLASGSLDNTIRIWDVDTGKAKQTLIGHEDSVNDVSFSHDGSILVSASSDRTLRVWDINSGNAIVSTKQTLAGHEGPVNAVALSPDGSIVVSASSDNTLRLWEVDSEDAIPPCKKTLVANVAIESLSFSKDGQYIKTDRGLLSLPLDDSSFQNQICTTFVNGHWISHEGQNLLWIPPDYRVMCSAFDENILVLGHLSGCVTYFQFSVS
ncbi:hypothetical protein AARAC_001872 [Aspergillus arachidicola]|uniref:Mitochondrial division protein 1 n=1 Tax=Aspergillus arachidicola TaxID=656916 RepID=A0A2G7FTH8_9EURO|nr:hypothetical protein AARAC_001872 [Aspergillus arachidicola]